MYLLLLIFSIVFNSSTADSSTPVTAVDKMVLSATDRCVSSVGLADKVYRAKEGYGIKLGTGSAGGHLVLNLEDALQISSIVVTAAPYAGDGQATKGFKLQGRTINWTSAELTQYTINYATPTTTQQIEIQSVQSSKNRFYVQRIDITAADPHPGETRITAPYTLDFESIAIVDGEPATDVQDVQISVRNATDSVQVRLKKGKVFSINQDKLAKTGGEINITVVANAQANYYDTLYIENVPVPMKVYAYTYTPPSLDTIPCVLDYSYANGLSDSLLKSALGEIAQCGIRYRYGSGNNKTWHGFYTTDRDTNTNQVIDMYSYEVKYFNSEKPTASVSGFDIEHRLPKSWWGGTVNRAYCDLHHLVPGNYSANRSKSNHAPGVPTDTTFWNGSFATGGNPAYPVQKVFCPEDQYKGDFARTYFYIATAYGDELRWIESGEAGLCVTNKSYLEFQPWLTDILLAWHRLDPVSPEEIHRAEMVRQIQGNRNPYVDYPDLVEYIWGNHKGEAYQFTPTGIDAATSVQPKNIIRELRNGHILIIRDGMTYTILGTRL